MAWLTNEELYYWDNGVFAKSYEKLGAHPTADGTWFALWAPHAEEVAVIGEFNGWDASAHHMNRSGSGLWEVFVPAAQAGRRPPRPPMLCGALVVNEMPVSTIESMRLLPSQFSYETTGHCTVHSINKVRY